MDNKIYTPMEEVLIKGALYLEALETKKKLLQAEELDALILKMEEQQGLLDGLKEEAYLL